MSFFGPLLVVFLLQRMTGVMAMGCHVDGDIRLDFVEDGKIVNQREYRLIQVCLFGQWSYVCNWEFGYQDVDSNVVLQQLQCQNGETTVRKNISSLTPAYLTRVDCVGIEKRLIDCPRVSPLSYYMCKNKVQVNCSDSNTGSPFANRECDNGQLHTSNTTNILYICVNGTWRTLCPSLWGPAQATVACRQLNPGRTVIKSVVNPNHGTPNQFKYHFFCTGKEKEITDCSLSNKVVDDSLCDGDTVATLVCHTGSVSSPAQLALRAVSSSSVEVNWTQPVSLPPQYRVSNHSITCTSSHGVYTTTTSAVNESTHMHMIVSGLMSSTSYICCVSAHSKLGTSESVCDTVITANQSDGTPLPWVGGVIIGAVLSTVILFTMFIAAVCLLRRKKTHSQHKLPDKNVRERSVSLSHTNDMYNRHSGTPQPYEEYQSKQLQNEPEYSYATHVVETNTYDSVPQQSSSGDDGHYGITEGVTVVDNTALYSMCAGEDVQENGVYSKLNRK